MGMSADFPAAIAMGSTHVRIGTAIFGERSEVACCDEPNCALSQFALTCDCRGVTLQYYCREQT